MLESQLMDISDFVNSKDGAPVQFDNGLPRVDGKYVPIYIKPLSERVKGDDKGLSWWFHFSSKVF